MGAESGRDIGTRLGVLPTSNRCIEHKTIFVDYLFGFILVHVHVGGKGSGSCEFTLVRTCRDKPTSRTSAKHGKGKLRPTGETNQHALALYARIKSGNRRIRNNSIGEELLLLSLRNQGFEQAPV